MLDGVAVTGYPLITYIALCVGHSTGLALDCAHSQVDRQTQNEATRAGGAWGKCRLGPRLHQHLLLKSSLT